MVNSQNKFHNGDFFIFAYISVGNTAIKNREVLCDKMATVFVWMTSSRNLIKIREIRFCSYQKSYLGKNQDGAEPAQNTSKYQMSANWMKRFGRYEHLKFRPIRQIKYRLWRHNYVIVVTSQTFFLPLCRMHQA